MEPVRDPVELKWCLLFLWKRSSQNLQVVCPVIRLKTPLGFENKECALAQRVCSINLHWKNHRNIRLNQVNNIKFQTLNYIWLMEEKNFLQFNLIDYLEIFGSQTVMAMEFLYQKGVLKLSWWGEKITKKLIMKLHLFSKQIAFA